MQRGAVVVIPEVHVRHRVAAWLQDWRASSNLQVPARGCLTVLTSERAAPPLLWASWGKAKLTGPPWAVALGRRSAVTTSTLPASAAS